MYKDQRRRMPPQRNYRDGSMSFRKWINFYIISIIPGINIIAWLVWILGGGKNATRTNFMRATAVVLLIVGSIAAILHFTVGFIVIKDFFVDLISRYIK